MKGESPPVSFDAGLGLGGARLRELSIACPSHLFCPNLVEIMKKRHDSPRVYGKVADRFVVIGEWTRRLLSKRTGAAPKRADMDAAGIALQRALPYVVGGIDHQTMVLKRGAERIRQALKYLRQICLPTVSPLAMSIRYGFDFAGPDRLLYASDHPWVHPRTIAGLSPVEEGKIFGGNARRLSRL